MSGGHFQNSTGCVFPYVLPDCTVVYASKVEGHYYAWQVVFKVFGVLASLACGLQLYRVFTKAGSSIQKGVYIFLLLSSGTFIVRGIDPAGFGAVVPVMADSFVRSVCTAAIYSIGFYIITIWAGLLTSLGSKEKRGRKRLQLVAITYSILTWVTLIVGTVIRTGREQTDDPKLNAIMFTVLFVLTVSGVAYLVYVGVKLDRKIKEAEKFHDVDVGSDLIWPLRALAWISRQSKVLKIVAVAAIIGIALAAYQFSVMLQGFNGIQRNPWFEYNTCMMSAAVSVEVAPLCKAEYPFDMFSVFQMFGVFLIYWSFWTIAPRKDNEEYQAQSILESGLMDGKPKAKEILIYPAGRDSRKGEKMSISGLRVSERILVASGEDPTSPSSNDGGTSPEFSGSWGSLMPSESNFDDDHEIGPKDYVTDPDDMSWKGP